MSIRQLTHALESGALTAVDVTKHALEQIDKLDPDIGAMVLVCADRAMSEATEIDRRRASGEQLGALAGVPVAIKDLEDVAGLPTRFGSAIFRAAQAAVADATPVHVLRAAGAVVVGKTNLSEFATEGFTANLTQPPTRNPWNPEMSPGGSSGGSAAAIVAGMVPIATATDGGGSVRIPASLCGLLGLKPTFGAVGRYPAHDWIEISSSGPLATNVDDLDLLFRLQRGYLLGDPDTAPGAGDAVGAAPKRIIATDRLAGETPLPDDVRTMFRDAVDAVARTYGLDVTWYAPGEIFEGHDPIRDWRALAMAEHVNALGRDFVEQHLDEMHLSAQQFLSYGLGVSVDEYISARRRRFTYVHILDELLQDAVLLTPTISIAGWLADGRVREEDAPGLLPSHAISTNIQNLTGHPALSLPYGMTTRGTPFGIQATMSRHRDLGLIEFARVWEQAHPWPVVADGYEPFAAALNI
jgi:Asp-tRNA(Asn)/Glu-tRNA(Gln) amidotransferase A subunit family amidase